MFPIFSKNRILKCRFKARQGEKEYILQLVKSEFHKHKLKVRLCWNPGRPKFAVYLNGNCLKTIKSTTGFGNIEGMKWTYKTIKLSLLEGRNELKFIMNDKYQTKTCSGCNKIIIKKLNFSDNLQHKKENVFYININV
jgi:hypothetical protein